VPEHAAGLFADEMQKNVVYSLPYSDELGEAKRR
jgi:hypothetical protein